MSTAKGRFPDASDLGLTLVARRTQTLQWQVYEARAGEQDVLAWQFRPDAGVDHRVQAEIWSRLGLAGLANSRPKRGLWPISAKFSARSASGWLIYRAVPQASLAQLGDPGRWRTTFADLARTLAHLHGKGALHLDLHPDNLYIDNGAVLLAGLGIDARAGPERLPAGQRGNANLGRPGYSAPELWDGSGTSLLGPWTDIYGMSTLMCQCLTGHPPLDFRQRIADRNWRKDLTAQLRPALSSLESHAEQIERLILTGLEPTISARPRSIEEWIGGKPDGFLPPTSPKLTAIEGGKAGTTGSATGTGGNGTSAQAAAAKDESSTPAQSGWSGIVMVLTVIGIGGAGLYGLDAWRSTAPSSPQAIEAQATAEQPIAAELPAVPAASPAILGQTDPSDADFLADAEAAAADATVDEVAMGLDDALNSETMPQTRPKPETSERVRVASEGLASIQGSGVGQPQPRPSREAAQRPRGDTVFVVSPEKPRIVQKPRLASGNISVSDFSVPSGGRKVRDGTSVQVAFTVQPNGAATDCRVTKPGPDQATNARLCSLVVSRLRFSPARDASGAAVASPYAWEQKFFITP